MTEKRAIQTDAYILDPAFLIPDGVKEFKYTDVTEVTETEIGEDFSTDFVGQLPDDGGIIDPEVPEPDPTEEGPTYGFRVVEQILRVKKNGDEVVDLIVRVDNVGPNATHEFRIVEE